MNSDQKGTKVKAKGRVLFRVERCKGCGFCIEFCPCKVLEFSKDYNAKGYHYPLAAHPEKCIGCNLCGFYCPDFAVWGEKNTDGEEVKK